MIRACPHCGKKILTEEQKATLAWVLKSRGLRTSYIAKKLGISIPAASNRLCELFRAGLVHRGKTGERNSFRFYPTKNSESYMTEGMETCIAPQTGREK